MKIKRTREGTRRTTAGNKRAWNNSVKRRLRILRMKRGCKERNANLEYIVNLTKANQKQGRTQSHKETSRKNATKSWTNPEIRKRRLRSMRRAFNDPGYRQAVSERTKRWWLSLSDDKKKDFVEKVWHAARRRMNKLEKLVKQLSRGCYLRYVGNNKLIVNGYCPDFAIKSRMKLVEVFGDYWHSDKRKNENRLRAYRNAGYGVLVIWEHQVKKSTRNVERRLIDFIDS